MVDTACTLIQARAVVRRVLGVRTLSGLRWSGGEAYVEAYHEHRTREGCGGYGIECS